MSGILTKYLLVDIPAFLHKNSLPDDGVRLFNLTVRPPINGELPLEYPDAELFWILSHYLLKKFYIRIGYDIYYQLCPVMLAPDIA